MRKSSDSSSCSCLSEDAQQVDFSEAEELLQDVIADLKGIHDQLHCDLVKTRPDHTTRDCKINSVMVKLQLIDRRLLYIHNLTQSEPQEVDNIMSNFGMSCKLDATRDKLSAVKMKHDNLRKEWYCQDQHLNKLAGEVERKENELKLQSLFCTTQGLVLSKMLWKSSKFDSLLDLMVQHDKLALELIKTLDGCLYAFTQTYADEMPEPSADEYQYVLCLCGILSNLASIPDGRFLLISQPVCRDVYDQMIRILPNVLVPKAEDLKWIMLTAIYNVMICKEGREYARDNRFLVQSLGECITPPHSNKIIILALKIISNLTDEIPSKAYMKHVSSYLPMERLEQLQQSKDSVTIRKQAKRILSSVVRLGVQYNSLAKEELIGTTLLEESKSRCQSACTQTCKKPNQELLAYYVFTDRNKTNSEKYSSSSASSSDTESEEDSSTSSSSRSETNGSKSSLNPDFYQRPLAHSAPVSFHHRGFVSRTQSPISDYSSGRLEDSSASMSPFTSTSEKLTSKFPVNLKFAEKESSTLCRPSTLSVPLKPTQTPSQLQEPTPSRSEEIQSIQYHIPQMNFDKLFSITIGDNIQNARINRRNAGNNTCPDGQNNGSIITVFRISNSKALSPSDNSFAPFYSTISTNTSFPWEAAMEGFLGIRSTGVGTNLKITTKRFVTKPPEAENLTTDTFDAAYGGYGTYFEKFPSIKQETQKPTQQHINDDGTLPSTSTGYYGYQFVPIQEQNTLSSTSSPKPDKKSSVKFSEKPSPELEREKSSSQNTKSSSGKTSESKVKCSKTKSSRECNRKRLKSKKGPFYRIFGRRRKH